jgi:hypothetical protein
MLIVANSISTHVRAQIKDLKSGAGKADFACQEVFTKEYYPVRDGELDVRLGPYESKVFVY